MKAAVLYNTNQPLQLRDLSQDPPRSGEVRLQMGAAGLCGSDRHFVEGTAILPLPAVIGHEGAGTVVEVGQGVSRFKPGDRIILSFVSSCGYCRSCRTGHLNLCDTHLELGPLLFDGTVRLHEGDTDVFQMLKLGVFSETVVVPQEACYLIPSSIPFHVGALIGCCVTTGVGAVINNPTSTPGMTVAVMGCGGVGLNVIQGARLLNASRIIAVDIHDHKLDFSYKFGATDVLNSRNIDPVKAIIEMTDGGVDMAFDSFGSPQTTSDAVKVVRKAGTAVMIGIAPLGKTAPIDMVDMIRGQKSLVGSYYGSASTHETFRRIAQFYLKEKIDIEGLVTRTYTLENVNEGLDALAKGESGRGIIDFSL